MIELSGKTDRRDDLSHRLYWKPCGEALSGRGAEVLLSRARVAKINCLSGS